MPRLPLLLLSAFLSAPGAAGAQSTCAPHELVSDSTLRADGVWEVRLGTGISWPVSPAFLLPNPGNPNYKYLPDYLAVDWPIPVDSVQLAAFLLTFQAEPRGSFPFLPESPTVLCVFRFGAPATTWEQLEAMADRVRHFPGVRGAMLLSYGSTLQLR